MKKSLQAVISIILAFLILTPSAAAFATEERTAPNTPVLSLKDSENSSGKNIEINIPGFEQSSNDVWVDVEQQKSDGSWTVINTFIYSEVYEQYVQLYPFSVSYRVRAYIDYGGYWDDDDNYHEGYVYGDYSDTVTVEPPAAPKAPVMKLKGSSEYDYGRYIQITLPGYKKGSGDVWLEIEKKQSNGTWTMVDSTIYEEGGYEYYAQTEPLKSTSFRARAYLELDGYWDDDDNYQEANIYGAYSKTITVVPDISWCTSEITEAELSGKSLKVSTYELYDENQYYTGYELYASFNGGSYEKLADYKPLKIPENQYAKERTYKKKLSYAFARSVKLRMRPYAKIGGKKYSGKWSYYTQTFIDSSKVKFVTAKKSVNLTFPKVSGIKNYVATYRKYNLTSLKNTSKKSSTKTSTSKTLKISNDAKKTGVRISKIGVTLKNGKKLTSYCYYNDGDSHSGYPLMNGAAKSKQKKITVYDTQRKKTKVSWSYTIPSKDRKIMKKFCDKHFTGKRKNYTRAQKAEYVMNWINKNVTYASGKKYNKISSKTYCDAIFNKKLGQCLQYDGAMAEFLAYLGYHVRIIKGYRATSSGKRAGQHFWCEVEVHGRWYCMETGCKKNPGWTHFCEQYSTAGGYMKNLKVAKHV